MNKVQQLLNDTFLCDPDANLYLYRILCVEHSTINTEAYQELVRTVSMDELAALNKRFRNLLVALRDDLRFEIGTGVVGMRTVADDWNALVDNDHCNIPTCLQQVISANDDAVMTINYTHKKSDCVKWSNIYRIAFDRRIAEKVANNAFMQDESITSIHFKFGCFEVELKNNFN